MNGSARFLNIVCSVSKFFISRSLFCSLVGSESATQGEGIFAQQSAFLHAAFSNLQILIHRTQIHRPHSSPALASLVICMTAARLCARVLDCQKNTSVTSLPYTQYSAFVACATLLSVDSRRDMNNIEKLIGVLQAQESRWAGAGRFW